MLNRLFPSKRNIIKAEIGKIYAITTLLVCCSLLVGPGKRSILRDADILGYININNVTGKGVI